MQKAIFSRIDLNNADNDLAQEYLSCIFDLLPLDDVQDLKAFTHRTQIASGFLQCRKSRSASRSVSL